MLQDLFLARTGQAHAPRGGDEAARLGALDSDLASEAGVDAANRSGTRRLVASRLAESEGHDWEVPKPEKDAVF